jgi:ribosome-binding protein aMBF1 (putative translation factor)
MPTPSLCFGRVPERKKEHEMASFYPYLYEAALALCIDARIKAGLTLAQLAERFGQTERFVASYESGDRLLDPAEYVAICRAIGVDPYELLQKAEKEVGN